MQIQHDPVEHRQKCMLAQDDRGQKELPGPRLAGLHQKASDSSLYGVVYSTKTTTKHHGVHMFKF